MPTCRFNRLNVTFPDRVQYCFENVCAVSVYGCLNTIDHVFYFHFASPGRDQLKYLEIIKYKTNEKQNKREHQQCNLTAKCHGGIFQFISRLLRGFQRV
jgi:hypothetical protein